MARSPSSSAPLPQSSTPDPDPPPPIAPDDPPLPVVPAPDDPPPPVAPDPDEPAAPVPPLDDPSVDGLITSTLWEDVDEQPSPIAQSIAPPSKDKRIVTRISDSRRQQPS